jgi:hypothetical protein
MSNRVTKLVAIHKCEEFGELSEWREAFVATSDGILIFRYFETLSICDFAISRFRSFGFLLFSIFFFLFLQLFLFVCYVLD